MRMRPLFYVGLSTVLFLTAPVVTGCADCDTSGCAALDNRAYPDSVTQGVAGIGATVSDVSWSYEGGPECHECPYGWVHMSIWKATAPITTAAAATELCGAGEPTVTVRGRPEYEQALDTGDYIGCVNDPTNSELMNCAAFTVEAGKITTINVENGMGASSLYVSAPGAVPSLVDQPLYAACWTPSADN